MDRRFLKNIPYLPAEIITNILSRLPIRAIISCKCVCKAWLELLETPAFADFHLSKSIPGLIVYRDELLSDLFSVYEFEDELELENHDLHYVPVVRFQRSAFVSEFQRCEFFSPSSANITMEGSANGLLLLLNKHTRPHSMYICNPVTREYINLPNAEENLYYPCLVVCGFGVSKRSGQYKVMSIFQKTVRGPYGGLLEGSTSKLECRVYTLGTPGSWRSVVLDSSHEFKRQPNSVFLNGNLHWLTSELSGSRSISCFDLETELFNAFSPPPHLLESITSIGDVGVLDERLFLFDNTSEYEIVIWVMKEYGVEKSWTKEIRLSKPYGDTGEFIHPFKVFRDGDILMLWVEFYVDLVYYSNKTQTISNVDIFELQRNDRFETRLHVSSFLSLKRFAMEDVAKF